LETSSTEETQTLLPEAVAVVAPKRGRPRKAVTTEAPLFEQPVEASDAPLEGAIVTKSEEAAEPAAPAKRAARVRKTAAPEPVEAAPKTRTRSTKKAVEPAPLEVNDAQPEPLETAVAEAPPQVEPQLEPAQPVKARARGRKKALSAEAEVSPEPAELAPPETSDARADVAETPQPATPKPRARGRKAVKVDVVETVTEQTSTEPSSPSNEEDSDANAPLLEGETAPVAPQKRLVRVRKTARENVFESQAKLTNPLEMLLEYLRANPGGQTLRDLEKDLEDGLMRRLGGRKGLESALEDLLRLGALTQVKRHTYSLSREAGAAVGRLSLRPDGWGVLEPETPGLREMLIPPAALLFAWHGDRVVARETKKNGEVYGQIIRVLDRALDVVVGTTDFSRGSLILLPDDAHLPMIPLEPSPGLSVGARVAVRLCYPETTGEDDAYGVIESVLGDADSPEAERRAVLLKFGLNPAFPADADKEAVKVAGLSIKDLQGRVDLRVKRVIAARISPSAPLEVGLQAEPLGNGNVLIGIHIADAQHFVDDGKAVDIAAQGRGVAVALGDVVLPLLPEPILRSASLELGVDRLAISILVESTPDGNVVNYIVRQSVVNAKAILEEGSDGSSNLEPGERELLERLTLGLRAARGADTAGTLSEELLLLANRLVAATLAAAETPALYRITPSRNAELESALERSGGASQAMLRALHSAHAASDTLIPSAAPELEYALSMTRGLTRYADLLNQRVLALTITKLSTRRRELLLQNLPALASNLSSLERNAQRAEESLKQFELQRAIVPGTTAKGIVINLDPWGMDFALENGALARLGIEDMDDEYFYSDAPKSLKARGGRVFKLGSIARGVVLPAITAAVAGRRIRLSMAKDFNRLSTKENPMSKQKRPQGAKNTGDAPRRQVVVLHAKPRGEYQRSVRVTARKLYFGEWSRAQFIASDEFGGEIALERPQQDARNARNNNHQARGNHPRQDARPGQNPRGNANDRPQQARPNTASAPQSPRPNGQNANPQQNPQQSAANRDQARASRIAELKRRSEQTLERNAARAVRGPMEGTGAPAPKQNAEASPAQTAAPRAEGTPHRRRRRGGRGNKAPAA
jgi:ribonuclease R